MTRASAVRLDGYRFALEHLVIESPQTDAVPVERALPGLGARREALEALGAGPMEAACDGVPPATADARPLSRKG